MAVNGKEWRSGGAAGAVLTQKRIGAGSKALGNGYIDDVGILLALGVLVAFDLVTYFFGADTRDGENQDLTLRPQRQD